MPTRLFLELPPEKQSAVRKAALAEFARYGYENGSTNRIVQAAGISKGSLFQYFGSKEELYFYLLDQVAAGQQAYLQGQAATLPADPFARVARYAALELDWYLKHPEECALLVEAFTRRDTDISRKVEARYRQAGRAICDGLLDGADPAGLRFGRQTTADLLRWFLQGFNEEFRSSVQAGGTAARQAYLRRLEGYLQALKQGLAKQEAS